MPSTKYWMTDQISWKTRYGTISFGTILRIRWVPGGLAFEK